MRIMIDPGHWGWDSGAVGPSGVYERDVAMAVAQIVAEILQQAGVEAAMTRQPESSLHVVSSLNEDLTTRVQLANNWPADIFVSIHANSFRDPGAHGMEVYSTPGEGPSDIIAEIVIGELVSAFPNLTLRADTSDGDRDKEAAFYVLQRTTMPAILVEMAFISNPAEEKLLYSAEGQARFAQAIASGILRYIGVKVPQATVTNPTAESIMQLQAAGIIASPDFWIAGAQVGKSVQGEYIAQLINNMASYLMKCHR